MARRFREVLAAFLNQLPRIPSEADIQIARRAASLAVWSEALEAQLAAGQPIDIAAFTTAANTLRRLLSALGATEERLSAEANSEAPGLIIEYVHPDEREA